MHHFVGEVIYQKWNYQNTTPLNLRWEQHMPSADQLSPSIKQMNEQKYNFKTGLHRLQFIKKNQFT